MTVDLDHLPFIQVANLSGGTNTHELIVVHTNEGPETKGSAFGLANYLHSPAPDRPGYHVTIDDVNVVRCAQDWQIPWGAGGVNSRALHLCIVGYSNQTPIQWDDPFSRAALILAADVARGWSQRYGIPVDARRPNAARDGGGKGLVAHADVSQFHSASMGHTDPGPAFPWDHFIAMASTGGPSSLDWANFLALLAELEAQDVEHGMAVDVTFEPNPKDAARPRGYQLDRWGGVHPLNGAKAVKVDASWKGKDAARKIVVTNWDQPSGYVMDLDGGLHPFGACAKPSGAGYWPGGKLVDFAEL